MTKAQQQRRVEVQDLRMQVASLLNLLAHCEKLAADRQRRRPARH